MDTGQGREHSLCPTSLLLNLDLERLVDARNAIAHSQLAELDQLRRKGYPVTLTGCREWQRSLNELAALMDDVVAASLAATIGGARPW